MGLMSKFYLDDNLRRSAQRMKEVRDKAIAQKRKTTIGDSDSAAPNPVTVDPSKLFFPESKG